MIFEFFVSVALDAVMWGASLLPDVDMSGVPDLSPVFGVMLTFDELIPVHEALQGVLLIFAVLGLMFVVKVLQTLIAHVPGIGGGGA